MPYLTILILGIAAGIAGYTFVSHVFIGLARRPRDQTHLIFALLSLSIAAHTLAVLVMQKTSSLAGYILIYRYFFGPTALAAFVCFLWFVACYAGLWPRRFLIAMSVWIGLTIALHVILPFGILYTDISGLRQITLPWGEQIVSARGTPNPLRLSFDLFNLVLFGFCFYALVRQYRGGQRRRALMLGLALVVFVLSRVVDTLIGLGVIHSMRTSEVAYVGVVVTMSLVLSHGITRTEIQLQIYQRHLKRLVAARTADLMRANQQLSVAVVENTRLYQRAVAARERLSALYQAAQAISRASLDPEQVCTEIHGATTRIMPAAAFAIILIDAARQEAEDLYLVDKQGRRPGRRYPLAHSFAGSMLRRNASVRIDDFGAFPQSQFAFEVFGDQPDSTSGLAVLLRGGEQVLGVLFLQSYAKGVYTDEDEESLELLAAHAAIALEHARRYQQAHHLAASEERTRLARELHDSVTQTLFSANLLAEALPIVWQRNAAEGQRNLVKLRQLVRGALAEMRTLLFELRPSALLAASMDTLLRQLGEVLTGQTRIPVELAIEGEAQLPVEVKIALYRITQEAFNNIAKHAGATQVWVTLRAAPEALFLLVRDDGRGFEPAAVPADCMGQRIMAERAAGIGARLRIDSAPQRGTEVSLTWPDPTATDERRTTKALKKIEDRG